jgi:hypothetical protein
MAECSICNGLGVVEIAPESGEVKALKSREPAGTGQVVVPCPSCADISRARESARKPAGRVGGHLRSLMQRRSSNAASSG